MWSLALMESTIIPPIPGTEKIFSTTSEPPKTLANIGMIILARGTMEFLRPWRIVLCAYVKPFVLARSINSEFMVSASSALK